jgi:hypothetical protein
MVSVAGGAISTTPSAVTIPSSATKDTTNLTTSARDAVLGTAELLEAIIYLLPSRDILANAQRVSRIWKDSITQSPGITKKLWLKSQASKAVGPIGFLSNYAGYRPRRAGSYYRSRILDKDLPMYPSSSDIAYNTSTMSKEPTKEFSKSNPFWQTGMGVNTEGGQKKPFFQKHFLSCEIYLRNPSATQHSWLDMYLTEPGITTAWLKVKTPESGSLSRFEATKRHRYSSSSVRDADGLTFATIVAVAEKICQSAPGILDVEQARVKVRFAVEVEDDGEDEEDGEDGWLKKMKKMDPMIVLSSLSP